MSDTVKVIIPRAWNYRIGDAKTATKYGPGRADIPKQLAINLLKAGHLRVENFIDGPKAYKAIAQAAGFTVEEMPAEPEPPEPPESALPLDFPGRAELAKAGVDTLKGVTDLIEAGTLGTIDGIGPKTTGAILQAAASLSPEGTNE